MDGGLTPWPYDRLTQHGIDEDTVQRLGCGRLNVFHRGGLY